MPIQGDQPIVRAQARIVLRRGMMWGEIKSAAELAKIPVNADVSVITDRNPNPTPLDPQGPDELEFRWDIRYNEIPE